MSNQIRKLLRDDRYKAAKVLSGLAEFYEGVLRDAFALDHHESSLPPHKETLRAEFENVIKFRCGAHLSEILGVGTEFFERLAEEESESDGDGDSESDED